MPLNHSGLRLSHENFNESAFPFFSATVLNTLQDAPEGIGWARWRLPGSPSETRSNQSVTCKSDLVIFVASGTLRLTTQSTKVLMPTFSVARIKAGKPFWLAAANEADVILSLRVLGQQSHLLALDEAAKFSTGQLECDLLTFDRQDYQFHDSSVKFGTPHAPRLRKDFFGNPQMYLLNDADFSLGLLPFGFGAAAKAHWHTVPELIEILDLSLITGGKDTFARNMMRVRVGSDVRSFPSGGVIYIPAGIVDAQSIQNIHSWGCAKAQNGQIFPDATDCSPISAALGLELNQVRQIGGLMLFCYLGDAERSKAHTLEFADEQTPPLGIYV